MWIIQKKHLDNQESNYLNLFKDYLIVDTVEDVHTIYENDAICRDGSCKFAGSVEFVNVMTRIYGHSEHFTLFSYDCNRYYPYLNFNLLNYNHILLPYRSILNQFSHIIDRFPNCDKFFIRPNSGNKVFTGTYFSKKWVSKELDIIQDIAKADLQDELVLVSPHTESIHSEYRIAFSHGKVLGSACYTDTSVDDLQIVEDKAQNMYDGFLKKYNYLNKLFTIDMCLLEDRSWKVVEINGFGTAGLYGMEGFII